MACPPPLLESLKKTMSVKNNKLTVELNIGLKSKKGPRIVITDLEMLDWVGTKGYNIKNVLKSGYIDNLQLKGNDPLWEFEISKALHVIGAGAQPSQVPQVKPKPKGKKSTK